MLEPCKMARVEGVYGTPSDRPIAHSRFRRAEPPPSCPDLPPLTPRNQQRTRPVADPGRQRGSEKEQLQRYTVE